MRETSPIYSPHTVFLRSSQSSERRTSYTLYLSLILTPFFLYFGFRTAHTITMYLDFTLAILCIANVVIVRLGLTRFFNVIPTVAAFLACTVALYVLYLGTDGGSTMLWIYLVPLFVFVLGGYLGIGINVVVLVLGTWLLANADALGGYDYPFAFVWRFAASYSILTAMLVGFEYWRVTGELERERLSNQLVRTTEERDTFANLASVCAWCRKIRGPNDEWLTLETYLLQREDRAVSHSICPDCAREQTE